MTGIAQRSPIWISRRSAAILSLADVKALAEEIAAKAAAAGVAVELIVIDTVARNFGGGDENSAQDASKFIAHCDTYLRERFNCSVVLVHHSGKKGDVARGSSAFRAACDQEYQVEPQQK
jgi:RecA-family ATPase